MEIESTRESSGLAARPLGFTYGTEQGPGSIPRGLESALIGMKVVNLSYLSWLVSHPVD